MSFLNGLSTMGQSIAQTASVAGLNAQKAELERQKEQLVSDLAEGREVQLQDRRQTFQATQASAERQFQAGQQTERLTSQGAIADKDRSSRETIATAEIAGRHQDIMAQMGAEGWTVQFDKNTGNPIRVNTHTGETAALTGPDGKPLNIINPPLLPIVKETVQANAQAARDENQTYTTQMAALRERLGQVANLPSVIADSTGAALRNAQAPVIREMTALTTTHRAVLQDLRSDSARATASLYARGATPADAGNTRRRAPESRPPLSDFLRPPGY